MAATQEGDQVIVDKEGRNADEELLKYLAGMFGEDGHAALAHNETNGERTLELDNGCEGIQIVTGCEHCAIAFRSYTVKWLLPREEAK